MRRNLRGRYRNNWNRNKNKERNVNDGSSVNYCTSSANVSTAASSVRAPANQLPIVIPISSEINIWKLYFPLEGTKEGTEVILLIFTVII